MLSKAARELQIHVAPTGYMTMGADPEIFSTDAKGKLLPAFTYLPSKAARPSSDFPFWDGFQAEFQLRPSGCITFVVDSMHEQLVKLDGLMKEKHPKGKLTFKNVFRIAPDVLKTTPDQYVALGCMPSYNAYGIKGECMDDGRELKHRFSGGHIHFQLKDKDYNLKLSKFVNYTYNDADYEARIKACDRIAGIWSVGVAAEMDSPVRRQYYGLPGEFRKPVYERDAKDKPVSFGVEWRTLSNFWCCHPVIMHATFEVARASIRMFDNPLLKLWISDEKEIIRIIAESDVKAARQMMRANKDMFKWLFTPRWGVESVNKLYDISLHGLDSLVSDPENIEKNWRFGKPWVTHSEGPQCNWRTGWDQKL